MLNVFSKVEVRSIVRFMRYGTRRVVFDFGSDREGASGKKSRGELALSRVENGW